MNTLKAKIAKSVENARQPDNKELVDAYSLVTVYKGAPKEVITARFYMGRSRTASTVYCCVWIRGRDCWNSGAGSAGGYGYCKISQAFESALHAAGVELYGTPYANHGEKIDFKKRAYIGGTGTTSIERAMEAIAIACGYRGKTIIVKH